MAVKPGYKQTEVGVIPESWKVRPFGDVATTVASGRSKVEATFGQYAIHGSTGVIGYCKEPEYEGDAILVARVGANAGKLTTVRGKYGVTDNTIIVRLRDDLSLPFFYRQLESKRLNSLVFGSGQPLITGSQLKALVVCVPSLPEQHAIATALNDVDALLGALERLIAKKRDLKQATMQQLLTGQTRLPGFYGEWQEKRLGDCLVSHPDYGINAAAVPFSDKLPSYIRITDISEYGRFCPEPRVSVQAASAAQYYLQAGDVVFARTGASVGKSYLYKSGDGPLVFAGFLIRVRPNPSLLVPSFLAAYTTTQPYWNWVRLMSMRSGQPGINGNEYAQLPLTLPTLPEQTAIANVLCDMDAELVALERRLTKTRSLKQGMMQELLTGRIRLL